MDKNKGFNWFYLLIFGALAVLFLPKLFSSSNTKTINEDEFFNMMKAGKVENLVLMRDSKEGQVFLTKAARTASKDASKQADNPLMALQPSPDFKFAFGDLQYFQQRYDAIKKENLR